MSHVKNAIDNLKNKCCQEKCHQLTFLCEPVALFRFVGPIKFKNQKKFEIAPFLLIKRIYCAIISQSQSIVD